MALRETDILTGLYTPGFLIAFGARELTHAHENGYPVSLIAVNIPNFESFISSIGRDSNEFHGISRTVNKVVGGKAIISRTTNTEIAILLPEVDSVKAAGIAYKLKRLFTMRFGAGVVISMGVASDTGKSMEINDLIKAARDAMAESKDSGVLKII